MRPPGRTRPGWWGLLAPVALVALAGSVLTAGRAAAATITVTPTSAPIWALDQFTVDGAGFGLYAVRFNGTTVGQLVGDVDNGVYHGVFPVPPPGKQGAAVCGGNRVDVVDNATGALQASATITAVCPSITVAPNPSAGTPGQPRSATYHVTPKDFPAVGPAPDLDTYQLTVDGQPQTITGSPADIAFTAALDCGAHPVQLTEQLGNAAATAGTTLVVMCAQISLAPASIRRSDEPTTISVAGTGFHRGRTVRYGVAGGPTSSGQISATGLFELPLPVAGLDCGVYQVSAVELPSLSSVGPPPFQASAPLTVTGCPGAPTPPPGRAPTVRVDPAVVQVGMTTHVTGSGFTPGQPVTLAWAMPDGSPLPGDCAAGADATGVIDTYCLVLPHGLLGARTLVATQGALTARAAAVVDGGTMQPVGSDDQLLFRR